MEITFKVCDKCGRITTDHHTYEIKTLKNGLDNGGFNLCWPCYYEITEMINDLCFLKGKQRLDKFVKEFNKNFGEINED